MIKLSKIDKLVVALVAVYGVYKADLINFDVATETSGPVVERRNVEERLDSGAINTNYFVTIRSPFADIEAKVEEHDYDSLQIGSIAHVSTDPIYILDIEIPFTGKKFMPRFISGEYAQLIHTREYASQQ